MILEALNYAATWPLTPAPFRPFVASSVSLSSRANRCRAAWAEHEERCRTEIAGAIGAIGQRRTCVVLGSGLLRDVPADLLSQRFDTVVLVDLVHLATVRARLHAKRLGNVRLVHRDLSGLDEARTGSLVEPLAFLRTVPYLDLVISANLLSQIGVGAERHLARQGVTEEAAEPIIARLIAAHVEGLGRLACPAILLTDTGFEIVTQTGTVQDGRDLMHGVALPTPLAAWTWPVAPFGEIGKIHGFIHRVVACRFNWPGTGQREEP